MNTTNTTSYTSNTNIEMLYNASNNMIMDKYKISINKNNLTDIIVKTVESISKNASLINTKTLNELNKLTLIKIKEFVELNINNPQPSPVPSPKPIIPLEQPQKNQETLQTVPAEKNIIDDDDLMNKMKSLEENRNAMNTLNTKGFNNNINYLHNDTDASKSNIEDIKLLLIDLIGTKTTDNTSVKETNQITKKDLFINSINRDWGFNKEINNLKLNIGIDIKNFYIEPHTILLHYYIKNDAPYIIVAFSDNTKTQNYNYIFNKNNGNWDEWVNVNNTIDTINIVSKNWKISLYDNRNNELHLYKDDIDIIEVIKDNSCSNGVLINSKNLS